MGPTPGGQEDAGVDAVLVLVEPVPELPGGVEGLDEAGEPEGLSEED